MYSFCQVCGKPIGQDQQEGKVLVCKWCGTPIGAVKTPQKAAAPVDMNEELIRKGVAARCSLCEQVVDVKASAGGKSLAAHFRKGERKMCPGSGKPVGGAKPAEAPKPVRAGKNLDAFMTKDQIKLVRCRRRDADPVIEQLRLDYLDKSDRLRIQGEAIRELLGGGAFQMKAYPAALKKPDMILWGNATECVVARKHEKGGFQTMTDAEVAAVVQDLQQQRRLFFG